MQEGSPYKSWIFPFRWKVLCPFQDQNSEHNWFIPTSNIPVLEGWFQKLQLPEIECFQKFNCSGGPPHFSSVCIINPGCASYHFMLAVGIAIIHFALTQGLSTRIGFVFSIESSNSFLCYWSSLYMHNFVHQVWSGGSRSKLEVRLALWWRREAQYFSHITS